MPRKDDPPNPAWGGPKNSNSRKTPVEFRKATYEKKSIFGKTVKAEGRAASKESKKDKWR